MILVYHKKGITSSRTENRSPLKRNTSFYSGAIHKNLRPTLSCKLWCKDSKELGFRVVERKIYVLLETLPLHVNKARSHEIKSNG